MSGVGSRFEVYIHVDSPTKFRVYVASVSPDTIEATLTKWTNHPDTMELAAANVGLFETAKTQLATMRPKLEELAQLKLHGSSKGNKLTPPERAENKITRARRAALQIDLQAPLQILADTMEHIISKICLGYKEPMGPYRDIPNPATVGPFQDFTNTAHRNRILDQKFGGAKEADSDLNKIPIVRSVKSEKGQPAPPANEAQIDHIRPRAAGGTNRSSNAQVIGRQQNRQKSDRVGECKGE